MRPSYLVIPIVFSLMGCEGSGQSGVLNLSGSGGSSSSTTSASTDALAYIEFYGTYTGASSSESSDGLLVSCEIPAGSPQGTDIDCPSFSMDEAILYNSTITIKWGTRDAVACPFVKFYPYYYRASNSASFNPEWVDPGSNIDCSIPQTTDSVSCYGGLAPLLSGTSFPFPTAEFFLNVAATSAENEISVDSSYSFGRRSNRAIANPPSTYVVGATDRVMFDGSDGIVAAFPGAYTGPLVNLQNYKVVCEDNFADPVYTLNFFFRDYDIAPAADNPDNPAFNDYPDWDSTLNTLDPQ